MHNRTPVSIGWYLKLGNERPCNWTGTLHEGHSIQSSSSSSSSFIVLSLCLQVLKPFHLIVYYIWDCELVTLSSHMSSAFFKISSLTVVTGVWCYQVLGRPSWRWWGSVTDCRYSNKLLQFRSLLHSLTVVDGDLCLQNYHHFDGPDLIGVMVRKAFNRQFLICTYFPCIFNHSLEAFSAKRCRS
jgi:hypothetical protein